MMLASVIKIRSANSFVAQECKRLLCNRSSFIGPHIAPRRGERRERERERGGDGERVEQVASSCD